VAAPGVTAEVDIVANNLATARGRALEEAFFLAVDQAFAEVVGEAGVDVASGLSPALVALRAGLRARARGLVRGYRILHEEFAGTRFRVTIDPRVDRATLRREIEKAQGGTPQTGTLPVAVSAAGHDDAADAVAKGLAALGVQVTVVPALPPAGPASGPGAVSIALTVEHTSEGRVRGPDVLAVRCRVAAAVLAPATTAPTGRATVVDVGYAFDDVAARKACDLSAGAELAKKVAPLVAGAGQVATGRSVTVELVTDQPAALESFMRGLTRVGAVSSSELRRIVVGMAEVRVRTRLSAAALADALVKDFSGRLELAAPEITGDRVRLQARVPADTTEPAPVPEAPGGG
jgi:hypothetical protein